MRGFYIPYFSSLDDPAHPDVVERLPDGTLLVIDGGVTVVTTSDGLAGPSRGGGSDSPNGGGRPFQTFLLWACAVWSD